MKNNLLALLVGCAAGVAISFGMNARAAFVNGSFVPNAQVQNDPQFCNYAVQASTLMSDAGGVLVPATSLVGRRSIEVCNSTENATGDGGTGIGAVPIVKCGLVYQPTVRDGGFAVVDAGCVPVPGVCYHDGGPSCGSTNTYNGDLDGGPVLADAGCLIVLFVDGGPDCPAGAPVGSDGGPCLVDAGPVIDAGFLTSDGGCSQIDAGLLDGGVIDAGIGCLVNDAGVACIPAWTLSGFYNPGRDGGFTFADGGPCLADAGYCLLDAGPLLIDGGYKGSVDAGYLFLDGGGPLLGADQPGVALDHAQCKTFLVTEGTAIVCIGTGNRATSVSTTECQ